MALRVLAKSATPVVEFVINGDEWMITTTGMRESSVKFTLGVEQDQETLDGRKVRVSGLLRRVNDMQIYLIGPGCVHF